MKVKQLIFWIVCAVFVCYTVASLGLVQETGPHHSTSYVNTTLSAKHFRILRPKSTRPESWEEENDTDLPTDAGVTDSGGIINNPEAKSTQSDAKTRVKRASGKVSFECIDLNTPTVDTTNGASIGQCIEYCWDIRKTLALLKKNDRCACISNHNKYTVVDISNCNTRCTNENTQNCGGAEHYSKYETGYVAEPIFNRDTISIIQRFRRGCNSLSKDLEGQTRLVTKRLTLQMCLEFCSFHRYKVATMNSGVVCQCAYEIWFFDWTGRERCTQPCSGNKHMMCGGANKADYDIYYSGYNGEQKRTRDERFEDLSWAKPAIKDPKDYEFIPGLKHEKPKDYPKRRRMLLKPISNSTECVALKTPQVHTSNGASIRQCIQYCWYIRKTLALLKENDQCACISNEDKYTVVDISYCNTRCTQNETHNCGGAEHYSKYETGFIIEPEFNAFTVHQMKRARHGCYRLVKHQKDRTSLLTKRMEPRVCMELCTYNTSRLAIIHNGDFCQCLTEFYGYLFRNRSEVCHKACSGNHYFSCGGEERDIYDVYGTGYNEQLKLNYDKRFEDLSWTKPAIKDDKDYAFFPTIEQEKQEREKQEKERLLKEKLEREKQEKEKLLKEKLLKEKLLKKKLLKEKLLKEKLLKKKLEKLRKERLQKQKKQKQPINNPTGGKWKGKGRRIDKSKNRDMKGLKQKKPINNPKKGIEKRKGRRVDPSKKKVEDMKRLKQKKPIDNPKGGTEKRKGRRVNQSKKKNKDIKGLKQKKPINNPKKGIEKRKGRRVDPSKKKDEDMKRLKQKKPINNPKKGIEKRKGRRVDPSKKKVEDMKIKINRQARREGQSKKMQTRKKGRRGSR